MNGLTNYITERPWVDTTPHRGACFKTELLWRIFAISRRRKTIETSADLADKRSPPG
jgi:hypothetical protein